MPIVFLLFILLQVEGLVVRGISKILPIVVVKIRYNRAEEKSFIFSLNKNSAIANPRSCILTRTLSPIRPLLKYTNRLLEVEYIRMYFRSRFSFVECTTYLCSNFGNRRMTQLRSSSFWRSDTSRLNINTEL